MKYDKISFQVLQVASAPFLRYAEQSNALKHSLLGNQKSSIWSPAYYMEYKHSSMAKSLLHTNYFRPESQEACSAATPKSNTNFFFFSVFSIVIIIIVHVQKNTWAA